MVEPATQLSVVSEAKADDAIREVHGCRTHYPDASHANEVLVEERTGILVLRLGLSKAKLTPWQARYLAAKLYRLSRRIRQRGEAQ